MMPHLFVVFRVQGPFEFEDECDLDAAALRGARAMEHLHQEDVCPSNSIKNCLSSASDVHSCVAMREIDDGHDVAVRNLVVLEEGVRVPVEQDMHRFAGDVLLVHRGNLRHSLVGHTLRSIARDLVKRRHRHGIDAAFLFQLAHLTDRHVDAFF